MPSYIVTVTEDRRLGWEIEVQAETEEEAAAKVQADIDAGKDLSDPVDDVAIYVQEIRGVRQVREI